MMSNLWQKLKAINWIYSIILIPLIIHVSFNIFLKSSFYSHIQHEPVKFGLIQHRGVGEVELWGLYGDAFDPKAKNVDFDVVLVSATVNPISILDGDRGTIIVWAQNSLLHSVLFNTYKDKEVFQKAVDEMVVSMGDNGEFVKYFLSPDYQLTDDYILKDLVHVYFWDVPNQGSFFSSTGINSMVAVPIFDPKYIYFNLNDLEVVHSRLEDNVSLVVKRVIENLEDIEDQKFFSVGAIAIPPLAGTCCRLDSWQYLDYETSYFSILRALENSKLSNPIDRIYLISYDKLPETENNQSLDALFQVYRYHRMRYWLEDFNFYLPGPTLRALIWIVPFWIIALFSHRKRKYLLKTPRTRQDFLLQTIVLATTYSFLARFANEIFLKISKSCMTCLVIYDLLFGLLSVIIVLWLNNRFTDLNTNNA